MTTEAKTAKPRRARDRRVQLTIRIDPDLLAKLEEAAEDRMVSKDLIIGKAIETFLEQLAPAAEALDIRPLTAAETEALRPHLEAAEADLAAGRTRTLDEVKRDLGDSA